MPWKLELTDRANNNLAAVWLASSQQLAVNAAMNDIERRLTRDPRGQGKELSEGLWAINCPPLRALYEIDDASQQVTITAIKESFS